MQEDVHIDNHGQAALFDTVIAGVTYMVASDPDVTNRFHSGSIGAMGGRGSNTAQYANPEVDALLTKGVATFDPAERASTRGRFLEPCGL